VAAVTGAPFTIFGDGKQVRDTLWVGDLVDAYERALARIDAVRGEVFNLGGGPAHTLSLRELVALLEQALGRRFDPPHAAWRPGDQRVFVADVRKAARLLGWSPRVATADGVGRLLDWVREHRSLFAPASVPAPHYGRSQIRRPTPSES
jgi:CDP-paratose 2-epimerase